MANCCHGRTAKSEDALGYLADSDGLNRLVEDLRELTGWIKKEIPGQPVFLLGHSLGATLAQVYISRYGEKLQGAILSGTTARQRFLLPFGTAAAKMEMTFRGRQERSPLMTALSFGAFNRPFRPNRTEFDWLSRDTAEVDKYERWQRRRLSMKPGLTCFWQINGRNEVDFNEWMRLDLRYIDNWSLALDAKILLKTIPVVFSRRGAV